MNLPAHGKTYPDPSIALLHKAIHKQAINSSVNAWRSLSATRRNLPRPQGGTPLAAKRQPLADPLLWGLLPGESHLAVKHHKVQGSPLEILPPGAPYLCHQALYQ